MSIKDFKVVIKELIDHKGNVLEKGKIFQADMSIYGVKMFYNARLKDGDIKEIFDNKKDTQYIQKSFNNKPVEKK